MKKDDIKEVYRELETYSKVPPEELWDKIEARLHPKKKKRRVVFFWGAAATILIILFGYMFTDSLKTNNVYIKEITDIEQPKVDGTINEANVSAFLGGI